MQSPGWFLPCAGRRIHSDGCVASEDRKEAGQGRESGSSAEGSERGAFLREPRQPLPRDMGPQIPQTENPCSLRKFLTSWIDVPL